MGNQYTSEEAKTESLRQTVRKHIPGWELVSKDGSKVTVRNTICHHERTIVYSWMFHLPEGLKCKECIKADRETEKERRRNERETTDFAEREKNVIDTIKEHLPDWDYVGGFTNSDGSVTIRHNVCSYEKTISLVTVRHRNKITRCPICEQTAREEKKQREQEEKQKQKEIQKAFKKVNYEQIQMKECSVCGAFFYVGGRFSKCCSKECSDKNARTVASRHKELRKKKAFTSESKDINLLALYRRDKGVCWLCGGICDVTLDPNNNYYPSIDHVFPIAKGGKDTWDNVKLAHRICNTMKSDEIRMDIVQKRVYSHSPSNF